MYIRMMERKQWYQVDSSTHGYSLIVSSKSIWRSPPNSNLSPA